MSRNKRKGAKNVMPHNWPTLHMTQCVCLQGVAILWWPSASRLCLLWVLNFQFVRMYWHRPEDFLKIFFLFQFQSVRPLLLQQWWPGSSSEGHSHPAASWASTEAGWSHFLHSVSPCLGRTSYIVRLLPRSDFNYWGWRPSLCSMFCPLPPSVVTAQLSLKICCTGKTSVVSEYTCTIM